MTKMISKSTEKKRRDKKVKDYFFEFANWPLLSEGVYQAQCIHYEKGQSHHNSQKLFLHFQITDGQYLGERLFMAIPLTDNKGQLKRRFGISSKLYKSWVVANNNQRPPRRDRLSTRIFMNAVFEIKVRTVKPKDNYGSELPAHLHYSVVDELIKRLS